MESKSFAKAVGGAFLVGGVMGVISQVLVMIYSLTPLYAMGFTSIAVLLTMGLAGGILFVLGVYPKIEQVGGMGASLFFCGLSAALSGMFCGVKMKTGSSKAAAGAILMEFFVKVIGVSTVVCIAIALIMHFTGFGAINVVPYAPGGIVVEGVGAPFGTEPGPPNGIPVGVDFASLCPAFFCSGIVCAIAQVVLMLTKAKVPVLMALLFVLGAVATPFGIAKSLVVFAGGGFQGLIIDAGEAVVSTFSALLQGGTPGPVPFVSVLCLFAVLYVMGVACGSARARIEAKKRDQR